MFLDGNYFFSYSRTQKSIALSSAEAEYLSLRGAASEALNIHIALRFLTALPVVLKAFTDSSACRSICARQGVGRIKHLAVRLLWLQQGIRAGRLTAHSVPTQQNPADIRTKPLTTKRIQLLLYILNFRNDDQRTGEEEYRQYCSRRLEKSFSRKGFFTAAVFAALTQRSEGMKHTLTSDEFSAFSDNMSTCEACSFVTATSVAKSESIASCTTHVLDRQQEQFCMFQEVVTFVFKKFTRSKLLFSALGAITGIMERYEVHGAILLILAVYLYGKFGDESKSARRKQVLQEKFSQRPRKRWRKKKKRKKQRRKQRRKKSKQRKKQQQSKAQVKRRRRRQQVRHHLHLLSLLQGVLLILDHHSIIFLCPCKLL